MKSLFLLLMTLATFSVMALVPGHKESTRGELISTNVGEVKRHIVTSREVIINNLIDRAIYKKGSVIKEKPLTYGSKAFPREVNGVLIEWAVYLEALNFTAAQVSAGEVEKAYRSAKLRLQGNKVWTRLDVEDKELRAHVERKVQAKGFIRFKVSSSAVPVSDQEAMEYYESNRTKFGQLPFVNFKENIKKYLQRQQVDRRLKDWFEILQSKYRVKNHLNEAG